MSQSPYQHSPEQSSLLDKLFALLLYLIPHHLLSAGMHWLTRCEWVPLKNQLIRGAIRLYHVDMALAEEPVPENYPSFNAFFTRKLRSDARPASTEPDAVLCPVDGAVSQAGDIEDGRIFQAKGHQFDLLELLGGNEDWAQAFEDGSFATIYLSPRDYHRIHMPLTGNLSDMCHVPGRLFSVSPSTTRTVPRLFSRNERVINLFETDAGPMAVIMVGAIFVSSMDTVWAGTVTPASKRVTRWNYSDNQNLKPVSLNKGDEMGRFNMGSTVILLFPKGTVSWANHFRPDQKVHMGEKIATLTQEQNPESSA